VNLVKRRSILIQRENELSLSTRGLNLTIRNGSQQKAMFEREISELLNQSVNILGPCHYARPLLHLMAGEWFICEGKPVQGALHFIEHTRIYEQLYPHIPNPKISILNYRISQALCDHEQKLYYLKRAIWGFACCFGENHTCTNAGLNFLNDLQELEMENGVEIGPQNITNVTESASTKRVATQLEEDDEKQSLMEDDEKEPEPAVIPTSVPNVTANIVGADPSVPGSIVRVLEKFTVDNDTSL